MKVSVVVGFLFFTLADSLFSAEFTFKVVDGLGRPVPEVEVHVEVPKVLPEAKTHGIERFELRTDMSGKAKGHYDEKLIPNGESVSVYLTKKGYESYSTDLRPEYVLQRQFSSKDVRRIVRLRGKAQRNAMKELLAGEFERDYERGENETLSELVFYYGRDLRPALRSLVSDPQVGMPAGSLLAFIGIPEDLRLVIRHALEPKKELFEDRWAYFVVSALFEPSTEKEWAFLRKCAANEFEDGWVDFGAIHTLKLIASPKSLQTLKEVQPKNPSRSNTIARAIEYIQARPDRLSDENLVEAGNKVAKAINIGNWQGNKDPSYNADEDMALIDCEFTAGRDHLTYTATFHRVGSRWKLRGVRETVQALMAIPPDRKEFVGVWHGYGESHLEFARLELKENGEGLLAVSQLPNTPVDNYRVVEWKQRGFRLDIKLEPIGSDAEPIELKNISHGIESLEFEVHGKGWSRKLTLLKQDEFERRAEDVRRSLEKLRTAK
jgi:hypothetical protein